MNPIIADRWAIVDDAVSRLERCWQATGAAQLPDFVPAREAPSRREALVRLIAVDQDYRWRNGVQKPVEQYLAEWPELQHDPQAISELREAERWTRAEQAAPAAFVEGCQQSPQPADGPHEAATGGGDNGESEAATEARRSDNTILHGETNADDGGSFLLSPGTQFGRYRIRSVLGAGGMGVVYRAHDTQLDREVALKIPALAAAGNPELWDRFVREARLAAKIHHPNVCPIFDAGQIDGKYFIAMALIEGRPLTDLLQAPTREPRETARIVAKIARALEAVHALGIVHRDIKLSNVIVNGVGEPVLTDFGLARPLDRDVPPSEGGEESATSPDPSLTQPGRLLGTPAYMSPEHVRGEPVDAGSDIYSLGVLLFQLLTGRLPFEGSLPHVLDMVAHQPAPRPCDLRSDLDPRLAEICTKAMSKEAADRHATARDLAVELENYVQRLARTRPARAVRRTAIVLLASAILLLAAWIFYVKLTNATLVIEIGPPDAKVTLDGQKIRIRSPRDEIVIRPGEHTMEVTCNGFRAKTASFTVERSGTYEIKVELVADRPIPSAARDRVTAAAIDRWIQTEAPIEEVLLTRDGKTLYVMHTDYPSTSRTNPRIDEWDVAAGRRKRSVRLPDSIIKVRGATLTGDGRYLFVADYFQNAILRIDLKQGDELASFRLVGKKNPLSEEDHLWLADVVVTPDGSRLVVTSGSDGRSEDENNDQVSVFDLKNGRCDLTGEVRLDDEPNCSGLGVSGDSLRAYVATRRRKSRAPTLYEISLTTPCAVSRTLAFPDADLSGVAVCGKYQQVFVADRFQRRIWIVSLKDFRASSSVPLDFAPDYLSLHEDGELLAAFGSQHGKGACIRASDGRVVGQILGLRERPGPAAFSRDRRSLLVGHGGPNGDIAVVNLVRLLFRGDLVFASNRTGGRFQLFVMEGEEVRQLTESDASDCAPRWSPDGRKIAFISDRDGPPRLCVMDASGEKPSVLKNTDPVTVCGLPNTAPLDWSPDGSQLVFIGDEHRAIRLVTVSTGQVGTLIQGQTAPGFRYHVNVCWSRKDGNDSPIIVASQHPSTSDVSDVFRTDAGTGEVTRMTDSQKKTHNFTAPAVSPQGDRIAAISSVRGNADAPTPIVLLAADGSELIGLPDVQGHTNFTPRWSHDGQSIVYAAATANRCHLWLVTPAGQGPVQLTAGDWDDIHPDIRGSPSGLPW